jgi:hypothetical protein
MTNTMRTNAAATIANASTTTILAVDLGKYKSVACVHGETTGECVFTTIETTRLELQRLIAKVQPGAVIIEACLLAGWVSTVAPVARRLRAAAPQHGWLEVVPTYGCRKLPP